MILYQGGGPVEDTASRNRVYAKYPRFKDSYPEFSVYTDPGYTKEKTGIGDVEYVNPKQDTLRYPSGYNYPHPAPGKSVVLRNPGVSQQGVNIDAFHGSDYLGPTARVLKQNFANAVESSKFNYDIDRGWAVEAMKYNDGEATFRSNEIDGILRGITFEGTPQEFEAANYWPDAKDHYMSNPGINKAYIEYINYLKKQ